MKFLVDAQLPPILAEWLRSAGHSADHVSEVGLRDADDNAIWQFGLRHGAAIVTKDEDFAAHARRARSGPIIIWIRVGNCSRRALLKWFIPLLPSILQEIERGERFIELR